MKKHVTIALAAVVLMGSWLHHSHADEIPPLDGRTNLASGKTVLFAPAPVYSLTSKDGTDATDLTDGVLDKRPDRKLWFEPSSVAWDYKGRVNLALDLGQQCNIDEVAIRLAGGSQQAGFSMPQWLELFVSDDGEHYKKVAEFSRWNKGDFEKFEVPEDAGTTWVHALRFKALKNAGALGGGCASMAAATLPPTKFMFFGSPTANQTARPQMARPTGFNAGTDDGFSVTHPQLYFHKPELVLTTNIATPIPVGLTTLDSKPAPGTFDVSLDIPAGVQLLSGAIGGVTVASITPTELPKGAKRYRFQIKAPSANRAIGRLYVQSPGWRNGQTGELRYRFGDDSWHTGELSIPLRAVTMPAAPRLKSIPTSMSWWFPNDTLAWPDVLNAWKTIGLNSFSAYGMWEAMDAKDDDPRWQMVEKARREGFLITNIESPYARMVEEHRDKPEIFCQFAQGHSTRMCPSYRGQYYQEELQRFAKLTARVKPDFSSQDIELWNWDGPAKYSQKCSRCQADFADSGLKSWEEWQKAKGFQLWSDLITTARAEVQKVGGKKFITGNYDFRPGQAYQSVFDFDQMYPQLMDVGQVSTYTSYNPYDLEFIGNEVRQDRARLSHSDIMPWLTPGDAGSVPGEAFQWALLESYCNGARGIYFWSGRHWDAETLLAYNTVIRAIAPVENVILEGQLVGDAAQVEGMGRVSGNAFKP